MYAVVITIAVIGAVASNLRAQDGPTSYRLVIPESLEPGQEAMLQIVFDIEAPWYIYAPTGVNEPMGMVETKISFVATDEVQTAKLQYPPHTEKGPFHVYEGKGITFTQPVRIRPRTAVGEYKVRGSALYQVCKPDLCLPPALDDIVVALKVE